MQCKNCQKEFIIAKEDLAFYDRVSPTFAGEKFLIPPPTFCPDCRYQRRLTYRNERKFYKRKCDLTGKEIISIYSADNAHKIYDQKDWWSDKWSPLDFGRDYDFSRSFFDQFFELKLQVPRPALTNHNSINSEYTNQAEDNKNCYYLTSAGKSEDSLYGHWFQSCVACVDCLQIENSELCYESVNILKCYNCKFLQNCSDCVDCALAYDCKSCTACLGCFGLRNQKYQILNKPVGQEEFEKKMQEVFLNQDNFLAFKKEYDQLLNNFPRKYYIGFNIEDSTGDYIQNAKRGSHCFNCRDVYEVKYAYDAWQEELGMDLTETMDESGCYEVQGVGFGRSTLFCSQNWYSSFVYYSDLMFHNTSCFGCVGLNKQKYCILNKQYEPAEFEKLVAKIIAQMQAAGEWGEFFPANRSHFAYNQSVAYEYFPITRDEATVKGYHWYNEDAREYLKQSYQVPENIKDVADEILKEILACVNCGKNYKIVPLELEYYRKNNIFIPKKCPNCRHLDRMALRNPRKLWHRQCMNEGCKNEFETTYQPSVDERTRVEAGAPDRPERVYCESCYQQEIY